MKTNNFTKFIFALFSAVLFFNGCFDLDSNLFNNTSLKSYNLSKAVIPESLRTQVVLSSQGKKIYGYYVQSSDPAQKLIVLYHHGNRDHLQFYWDRVEFFYQMGFNVFIYDYQGYGMSEGEASEAGIYSDATAAYQFVRSKGFTDNRIINYGFSLGGAPATYVASHVFTPKVHILESTFASAEVLVQSGTLVDFPGSFFMNGKYPTAENITSVHCPVLIMHGEADTFIDMEKNGKVIYRNANNPKEFVPVPGANHSDVPQKMGIGKYFTLIKDFSLK